MYFVSHEKATRIALEERTSPIAARWHLPAKKATLSSSLKECANPEVSIQSLQSGRISTPSSFYKSIKVSSQAVLKVVTRQAARVKSSAKTISSRKLSRYSTRSKWPVTRVGLGRGVGWIRVRWFEGRWEAGRRMDPSSILLLPLRRKLNLSGLGGESLRWPTLVWWGRRWEGWDGPAGEEMTLKRRASTISPFLSLFSRPNQVLPVRSQPLTQVPPFNRAHQFSLSCLSSLQTHLLSHLRVLQENPKPQRQQQRQ